MTAKKSKCDNLQAEIFVFPFAFRLFIEELINVWGGSVNFILKINNLPTFILLQSFM